MNSTQEGKGDYWKNKKKPGWERARQIKAKLATVGGQIAASKTGQLHNKTIKKPL